VWCGIGQQARMPAAGLRPPASNGALAVATGEDGVLSWGRLVDRKWEWEGKIQVAEPAAPLTRRNYEDLLSLVPETVRARRENVFTAPVKSSVCGLEVASNGTVWVRMADREGRESWEAFDPRTRRRVAELRAPAGVALQAFSAGHAFGVWKSDLDVQYVMVYSIGEFPRIVVRSRRHSMP
jgi:hypothetical protein